MQKKTIEDLKAKADSGDKDAQNALGLLFELGLEVSADIKEAAKYLGMAAKSGDALAQFSLANIISKDFEDTDENRAMAQALFKKAESQGFVREDKALRLLEREKGKITRVLIVDDALTCRVPLRKFLEDDSCEVIEAEDGQKALNILKKDKNFNLIVTDVHMPNLDGLALLKAIRLTNELKQIPVIIVTGENEAQNVVRAREIGVQGWILKPVKAHVLQKALAKFV